jgi:hypothetical protein
VQRRVVQAQLGERVAERLVVLGVDREHAGEHARLICLKPGSGVCAHGRSVERDGVADRRAVDLLDAGDHEADLARRSVSAATRLRREAAELVDLVAAAGGHTRIFSPTFSVPLTTRTSDTTPT